MEPLYERELVGKKASVIVELRKERLRAKTADLMAIELFSPGLYKFFAFQAVI